MFKSMSMSMSWQAGQLDWAAREKESASQLWIVKGESSSSNCNGAAGRAYEEKAESSLLVDVAKGKH